MPQAVARSTCSTRIACVCWFGCMRRYTYTHAHMHTCTPAHTPAHTHTCARARQSCCTQLHPPTVPARVTRPCSIPAPPLASIPHPISSMLMLVQDGNGSCSERFALGQQTSSEPCCRVLDGRSAFCALQRRFRGPRRYRYIPQMKKRKAMRSPHLWK